MKLTVGQQHYQDGRTLALSSQGVGFESQRRRWLRERKVIRKVVNMTKNLAPNLNL
jgi:hypothetical protein